VSSVVIGERASAFKSEARDEIERREIEQADYLSSLEDDSTVVNGPESWFKNSAWSTSAWGAPGYRYRRTLELAAHRDRRSEAAGAPGMLMMEQPSADDPSAYVEAAITRILDKLRNCPPKSQDTTMNTTAFALNCKLAGKWPGLTEHELKARFLEACRTLRDDPKSGKGKWKETDFEEKWRNAKRDAATDPDTWPPKEYKPRGSTNDYALKLLREAAPLGGTLGEKYFRDARNVNPDRAEEYLFFHPKVSCGKGKTMAAVLCAYRAAPDGKPVAVHVTYVGTNGSQPVLKVRKRTFGKWSGSGAALYLSPVGRKMLTGEGVEKTLKGMNVSGLPGIAAGSDSAMKAMAILEGIEELIILADRGEAGELAAKILAWRANAAGVKVRICFPPVEGLDWDECEDDAVRATIEDAPLWEPEEEEESEAQPNGFDKSEGAIKGRPEFRAPNSAGELTPVMSLLDKLLSTNEAVPPMRSLLGWPVEVEEREPAGFHELTSAGSNNEEADESRLPPPKSAVLARHNTCTMALLIEQYARFFIIVKIMGVPVKVYTRLAGAFVTHFLEHKKSKLPKVSGLLTMPIVLPDGKLLASNGLDRDLKTVFCIEPLIIERLPKGTITDDQIARAMRFLTDEWFADVSTNYTGKCTLIALALSILERQLFNERPAFFITAGKRGTGKTTAATMIALALLGKRAAAAAWSPKEEERRKAVFAALLQSMPLIVWDNIKLGSAISCPTIEKVLTSPELEDRVLGESRGERASCATIQVFTGNNISAKGDMASRSLNIRLTTDRPDPENRPFKHADPFAWTLAHRGKIIEALYTILLGNPRFSQPPKERQIEKTRFKPWWHLVGAPIEYAAGLAGEAVDFGQAFHDTESEDEDAISVAEVLAIFLKMGSLAPFYAADVVTWLGHGTENALTLKSFFVEREGVIPSSRSIGKKLKTMVDNPVWADEKDILTLRAEKDTHTGSMIYHVERSYQPPF